MFLSTSWWQLLKLPDHDGDGNKHSQICILNNENEVILHALHVHFSFLYIS